MGNQTSQWFALYYLDGLDRLIKEKLWIKYYSRYMDDMILIHQDKDYLKQCLRQMTEYVEKELKLEFNEKTQIHHIRQGIDYIGFHFYLTETGKVIRKLRQSRKKKLKKKIKAFKRLYANDEIEFKAIGRSLVSYNGHLKHGHTYHLRKRVWNNLILIKGGSKK